jgi:hypothetical protein
MVEPKKPRNAEAERRAQRLAAQLRENLKRRKDAQRNVAKDDAAASTPVAASPPESAG